MVDNRVGRILLSGEGSARFASSLIRPSRDEVAQHNRQMDEINSNISLNYNNRGFEAVINNLNLSFINHNTDARYETRCGRGMTVKVLIERLSEENPDAIVYMMSNVDDIAVIVTDVSRNILAGQEETVTIH